MSKEMKTEQGIPVGNVYNKYGSRNPLAKLLMGGFLRSLFDLVEMTKAVDVHEVGCGEGHLCGMVADLGDARVRGSDFSEAMISVARDQNERSQVTFSQKSIYELASDDGAELIMCCEVMEHLDRPDDALEILSRLARPYCILTVPHEPLWRILNMSRGRYLRDLGNTPGHVQHWSRSAFEELCSKHFDVIEIRSPVPWTQVLCRARSNSQ